MVKSYKILLIAVLCIITNAKVFTQSDSIPIETLVRTVEDDIFNLKKFKISGYLQAYWQFADTAGIKTTLGGDFDPIIDNRFMVRRARLKISHITEFSEMAMQFEGTERGVSVKDAFIRVTDPYINWFSLKAGIYDHYFGFETPTSSSSFESLERARVSQAIFNDERLLGTSLAIQGPKGSPYEWYKLEFGVCTGSGPRTEYDNHKDLLARISMNKPSIDERFKIGLGLSYYKGGYAVRDSNLYTFTDQTWKRTATTGEYARSDRNYIGVDGQFSLDNNFGISTIRAEYIMGKHPNTVTNNGSLNDRPVGAIYERLMSGLILYFIQNIQQSRYQFIAKYDIYDPNTKIAGDEVKNASEIKYNVLELGANYFVHPNFKLGVYYNVVKNEISKASSVFNRDLPDNILTLKLQYRY